jgi:tryptophan synthase alpha chain
MPLSFENRPTLVAYLTCGDPDLATTREIVLAAAEAGAGTIELGVPFSDPVADGPVIQRASERALRQGTTLAMVLHLAGEIRRRSQVGLIIFSYLNPILQIGMRQFCDLAEQAGVDGAIITDLPVEEADEYVREMRMRHLSAIFLTAPTSTDQRLQKIAKSSSGFIYAVSRTGVTGAQLQLPDDARKLVKRIGKFSKLPVAVGFGIATPEQFAAVGEFAPGAVVGTAIVQVIERNPGKEAEAVADFVRKLLVVSERSSATMA